MSQGAPGLDPLLRGGPARRFLRGAGYVWRGLRVLGARRSLWPLALMPVLLSGLLLAVAATFAVLHAPGMLGLFWSRPSGSGVGAWLLGAAWWLAAVLAGVVLVTLSAVLAWLFAMLLSMPFSELISQRVEAAELGPRQERFSVRLLVTDIRLALGHALLDLAIWLAVILPALLLNLVPAAGSLLFAAVSFPVSAFFLARQLLDGPMSRRRLPFATKLAVARRHLALVEGFGVAVTLLLWVPLVNLLLLPVAVVGGTLLYCDLQRAGVAPGYGGEADPGPEEVEP